MTFAEFLERIVAKREAALAKAQDTTLPARYRETFALRAEVYQEILDSSEGVQA